LVILGYSILGLLPHVLKQAHLSLQYGSIHCSTQTLCHQNDNLGL
jgi:hypothetical protein